MKAIRIKNITTEDFVGIWGGVEYPIPAGDSLLLEEGIARKFAKDLAMRECGKNGKLCTEQNMRPIMVEVLDGEDAVEAKDKDELNTKVLNAEEEQSEEEFEGLEDIKEENKEEENEAPVKKPNRRSGKKLQK
jgi:hypothetical protein